MGLFETPGTREKDGWVGLDENEVGSFRRRELGGGRGFMKVEWKKQKNGNRTYSSG